MPPLPKPRKGTTGPTQPVAEAVLRSSLKDRFLTFMFPPPPYRCRSNSCCTHPLRSGALLGCPTKPHLQKLGSRPRRQQAWEDNLSTLNAEDKSLWGIAKAFRKKTSPISALNGPTGIVLSDTNKTEVIAHSLESQFQLNDIHNPHKDEIITSVVDAYMNSNTNNTDNIPPLSHLK
ncbi:uncharacterized protein TNCV_1343991 [Trichonephila clavipes]|nr:uncharacterized protein TNCV_1343991 [Trichonephila clavipes]